MSDRAACRKTGGRARGYRRIMAVAGLLLLAACSKTELYTGLSERDANEMLALLLRAGIATEKAPAKTGVTISVDSSRVPDAVAIVSAAGLPHAKYANMGELFKKEGMISSPSEERVRYIYGISQELSRTLSQIDGVLDARVHIVLPGNDPTNQSAKPSSAAVLIRYAPDAAVDGLVPKIKELVVNSIEGLSYERVSVVLIKANVEEGAAIAAAAPPENALDHYLTYGLGGLLVLSIAGNGALGFHMWRRNGGSLKAAPTPT